DPRGHLEQVVRPADPPGDEPGEVEAEDARNSTRMPERRHGAERLKDERHWGAAVHDALDVARELSRLAHGVLRERWIRAAVRPRDRRAVTQRPQLRMV